MKPKMMLSMALCAIAALAGCSSPQRPTSDGGAPVAGNDVQDKQVRVVVRARSAEWKVTDVLCFDVVIRNGTADSIRVPYLYDWTIEIDGEGYTQFPKPRLIGENDRIVAANSEVAHGGVILNGKNFTTVDARTGRVPLKLRSGEHTLVLVCGPYRSDPVRFKLEESEGRIH